MASTGRELLLSIHDELFHIRDKEDVLRLVNKHFRVIFPFSHSVVTLTHADGQSAYNFLMDAESKSKASDPDYWALAKKPRPMADGIYEVVLASELPVVFSLEELMQQPAPVNYVRVNHRNGMKALIGIRLMRDDRPIGTLAFFTETKQTLSAEDQQMMISAAQQVSVAVSHFLASEEIREREQERALLLNISTDIAAIRDRDDLFELVHTKISQLLGMKGFVITLIDAAKQTDRIFFVANEEIAMQFAGYARIKEMDHPIGDTMHRQVLTAKEPVYFRLDEVMAYPDTPAFVPIWLEMGRDHIVGYPLTITGQPIGILWVYAEEPMNTHLLQGLAAQIAVAISNIVANERIARQMEEINSYKKRLEEENLYLQEEIVSTHNNSELIGDTPAMHAVFNLLSQVSYTNSSVLILGETGTGKELVARAIHTISPRKDKLMVKINCAALPANLIESELFGHERGSFTGAVDRRVGKFELAHKGTLFLDEIGEMPLELQVKLLRAIQEKEIERIGGKAVIKVDVRIIAATNRNLLEEVKAGRFRSDLYYRLNVFPITLPPLRERKEDIPRLVTHFMNRFSRNIGKQVMNISNTAMEDLLQYSWPGNVRELEHMIERTVLLSNGNTIREVDLPVTERQTGAKVEEKETYIKTLEENERDHILAALDFCKGKIYGENGAAAWLGVPVSTLNSKMKKLGIIKQDTEFGKK